MIFHFFRSALSTSQIKTIVRLYAASSLYTQRIIVRSPTKISNLSTPCVVLPTNFVDFSRSQLDISAARII